MPHGFIYKYIYCCGKVRYWILFCYCVHFCFIFFFFVKNLKKKPFVTTQGLTGMGDVSTWTWPQFHQTPTSRKVDTRLQPDTWVYESQLVIVKPMLLCDLADHVEDGGPHQVGVVEEAVGGGAALAPPHHTRVV